MINTQKIEVNEQVACLTGLYINENIIPYKLSNISVKITNKTNITISEVKVEETIKDEYMRNSKSPGIDGILNELFKHLRRFCNCSPLNKAIQLGTGTEKKLQKMEN